ncbi:PaaI family thioesterase [Pseudomarimonas arenosa]|uniref:PaaI family thioesterase n=1 Tax=Pseudomarimonas arenosa TaxID=2774145 RepID=A0AAW3ZTA7_9GAMM|nr:PaaI family thioesterase [Pseudomarimonas arenosa]MBD8528242.1 PaaI family thioesterase [Pseudomarimonas arenosa]
MDSRHSPTEHMVSLLKQSLRNHPQALMPPPCFVEMQSEVMDYFDGVCLRIRFPVLTRYQNPWGFMQGGFVAAALDNTIGPFSFLVGPPNVTSTMQIHYLRPVTPDLPHIECQANLLDKNDRGMIIQGRVLAPDLRVLVLAQANCQIV